MLRRVRNCRFIIIIIINQVRPPACNRSPASIQGPACIQEFTVSQILYSIQQTFVAATKHEHDKLACQGHYTAVHAAGSKRCCQQMNQSTVTCSGLAAPSVGAT